MRAERGPLARRRIAAAALLVACGLLACIGGDALRDALSRPPSRAWLDEHFWGDVLAYEVWDGTPHVVFAFTDDTFADGRVYVDHLVLDWVSIDWPPTPRWQASGA